MKTKQNRIKANAYAFICMIICICSSTATYACIAYACKHIRAWHVCTYICLHGMQAYVQASCHVLMNFGERVEWLLKEIGETSWDIIVFTETWRADRVEVWRTEHGHTWLGSGGMQRHRGVGFLLHSRWQHLKFKPLSERVGVVDVKLQKDAVLRIVGVYMPHAGHSDDSVEQVYSNLAEQCNEAREKGYMVLLAGDFNAEVGICSE